MNIVWMLVIGLAVGVGATLLLRRRDPRDMGITVFLGVSGSIAAGFVGRSLGWYRGPWEGPGFIGSVVGAMLLLLLYGALGGPIRSRLWPR